MISYLELWNTTRRFFWVKGLRAQSITVNTYMRALRVPVDVSFEFILKYGWNHLLGVF